MPESGVPSFDCCRCSHEEKRQEFLCRRCLCTKAGRRANPRTLHGLERKRNSRQEQESSQNIQGEGAKTRKFVALIAQFDAFPPWHLRVSFRPFSYWF